MKIYRVYSNDSKNHFILNDVIESVLILAESEENAIEISIKEYDFILKQLTIELVLEVLDKETTIQVDYYY